MFDNLSEKLTDAFRHLKGESKISQDNIQAALKEVRQALLEADVNFTVVKAFMEEVKEKALGEKVVRGVNPGEQFIKLIHDELARLMGEKKAEVKWARADVTPILVVGLNGAGKTTFSGKLSLFLRRQRKKDVMLVPADTYRPAAKDQLQTLARGLEMECFDSDLSLSPAQIAEQALAEARKKHKDVVVFDTAGRLHVDDQLMEELAEVKKSLEHLSPEVFIVVDAMTGQEAINVVKSFHEKVGLTGVVLSKMDSDARGGAALSIRYMTEIPIHFFSSGEKMKDLEVFHPDRLAKRILDMGDIVGLVEKAEEVVNQREASRMMDNLEKNQFSIEDFMAQMEKVSQMGSLGNLMKMIPGMGGMMRKVGDLAPAEAELKKMKVIISSMTVKERKNHQLLGQISRRKRVARGSGVQLQAVDDFLKKFEQMRKMMSNFVGAMKKGGNMDYGTMMGMAGVNPPPGFRQGAKTGQKGQKNKKKGKGKGKGPWGKGYF